MDGRPGRVTVAVSGGFRDRLKVDESGVALIDSSKAVRVRWSEMERIAVPEEATTIVEFIPTDPGREPVRATVSPHGLPPGPERTQFVTAVNEYAALFAVPSSLTEEKIAGRPSSPRAAAEGPRKSPAIKGALGDYVALVVAAQPDPPRRFDRRKVLRMSAREALVGEVGPLLGGAVVLWPGLAGPSPNYEVFSLLGLGFLGLAVLASTLLLLASVQIKYARASRALCEGVRRPDEGAGGDPVGVALVHPASGRLLVRLPDREAPRS